MDAEQKERAARIMRDAMMEQKSGDKNWEHCREAWMRIFCAFQTDMERMGLEIRPIEAT